jgi:hypothetical protein
VYSTCIFCHSDLGTNESVEHFPIGGRLAFDAARGRLWVVCQRCERWNLTPLEERWEAIEECERLFRSTKLRVSTDQIGLARLRDGLELVRIGEPQRPEMAAWRYGDQFGRRRRQALALSGITVVTAAALYGLGPLLGVAIGGIAMAGNLASMAYAASQQRRVIARISVASRQRPIEIRGQLVRQIKIDAHGDDWALIVPFEKPRNRLIQWATSLSTPDPKIVDHEVLTGDFALRTAAKVLPAMNWGGGRKDEVRAAVDLLEESSEAHALFRRFVIRKKIGYGPTGKRVSVAQSIQELPVEARLALEMAAHEDAERRALEGELHLLEDAWREAEEIAAISDTMLVSPDTSVRLSSMKQSDER